MKKSPLVIRGYDSVVPNLYFGRVLPPSAPQHRQNAKEPEREQYAEVVHLGRRRVLSNDEVLHKIVAAAKSLWVPLTDPGGRDPPSDLEFAMIPLPAAMVEEFTRGVDQVRKYCPIGLRFEEECDLVVPGDHVMGVEYARVSQESYARLLKIPPVVRMRAIGRLIHQPTKEPPDGGDRKRGLLWCVEYTFPKQENWAGMQVVSGLDYVEKTAWPFAQVARSEVGVITQSLYSGVEPRSLMQHLVDATEAYRDHCARVLVEHLVDKHGDLPDVKVRILPDSGIERPRRGDIGESPERDPLLG